MNCKLCKKEIPENDIIPYNMVARCRKCQISFAFSYYPELSETYGIEQSDSFSAPQSANIRVIQEERCLKISARWLKHFQALHYFIIIFTVLMLDICVIGDFICDIMGIPGIPHGAKRSCGIGGICALVIIAPLMNYLTLIFFANQTVLEVTDKEIFIHRGPLFCFYGNNIINPADIIQLYCKCEGSTYTVNSTRYDVRYHVKALLKNGQNVTLFRWLREMDALFVEQQIEKFLNIEY